MKEQQKQQKSQKQQKQQEQQKQKEQQKQQKEKLEQQKQQEKKLEQQGGQVSRGGRILGSRKNGEKIDVEVNEKHVGIRVVIFAVSLIVAVSAFAYGINSLMSADPGWQVLTVNTSEDNCGSEFTFLYNVGAGDVGASKEKKAVRKLYSEICVEAYEVFDTAAEYEECPNICYLMNHINEEVKVEPLLYQALSEVEESGMRYLYTGAMTAMYGSLAYSMSDQEAAAYDPYRDEDLMDFYAELSVYLCDPEMIHTDLLGDNTVRLYVSDDYLSFAEENNITELIDFSWMKNAFIADYIASTMIENGYTLGVVMSSDGYVRAFDSSDSSNAAFPVYHRDENLISLVTAISCEGNSSYVYYRDYPLEDEEPGRYYTYQTGEIRSLYADPLDGLCKAALPEMVFCSENMSCAELMLSTASAFIADEFDENVIQDFADEQIIAMYCEYDELKIIY